MLVWIHTIKIMGCSNRSPVAAHCSLVERSTVAGWRAAVGRSPADTGLAVDCTESYLEVKASTHQLLLIWGGTLPLLRLDTFRQAAVAGKYYKMTITSFIVVLRRFIKGPVIALLTIWRLLIRVLPMTCGEHNSAHAKNSLQRQNPLTHQREIIIWFEAKTFIIHVQWQNDARKQHFQSFSLQSFQKNKTTVRKLALFHHATATTLSEIWNFSTPKGTVWTQTHWEETELTPMPVEFCFVKEDSDREEELKLQHDSKSGLGLWDNTKRKWHVL